MLGNCLLRSAMQENNFLAISGTVAVFLFAISSATGTGDDLATYQEELVSQTASLRPGWHSYAGYNGPWLENAFFKEWSKLKPRLTRVYIPVAWTDCMHTNRLKAAMQEVLTNLKPQFKYFTVLQADLGFNHDQLSLTVPSNIDFILFSSGGDSPPLNTVPVPLLKEELKPAGFGKTISVSFQASVHTHPIRQAIYDQFNDVYLFLGGECNNWKMISESSNMSFCPRGFGTTSFRMFETLQLGTIPLYVWQHEKWLPFQEIIDWNEFAVVIEAEDIPTIPARLAQADIPSMMAALKRYHHMFTYNYTIHYILEHFLEGTPTIEKQHGGISRHSLHGNV